MRVKKKTLTAAMLLTLACTASAAGTFAYLKFNTPKVENTFLAAGGGSLVSTLTLDEHPAVKEANGTYTLNEAEGVALVTSNTYDVLPGVDIPKDPTVHVNGKTSADAYLYVEVVDALTEGNPISWEVAEEWTLIDRVTGPNAGMVYVYNDGTNAPAIIDNDTWNKGNADIEILKDNMINVEDGDLHLTKDSKLTFYAYMAQASAGKDAKAAYTACFLNENA